MPEEWGIAVNEGLSDQLSNLLGKTAFGIDPWQLFLFSNDLIPAEDTVWASITEAVFGGYARITLTPNYWETPVADGNSYYSTWKTVASLFQCTSAPEMVYGFGIVTTGAFTLLKFIQRFDDPIDLVVGGVVGVLPKWRHQSIPDPTP